jgi:hypothetical protein
MSLLSRSFYTFVLLVVFVFVFFLTQLTVSKEKNHLVDVAHLSAYKLSYADSPYKLLNQFYPNMQKDSFQDFIYVK